MSSAQISVRGEGRHRSNSTREIDMQTIAVVEEQRSKLQAAYDELGDNDSTMKRDLEILLNRMDLQLQRIRDRQQQARSRLPCMECFPCVISLILYMP